MRLLHWPITARAVSACREEMTPHSSPARSGCRGGAFPQTTPTTLAYHGQGSRRNSRERFSAPPAANTQRVCPRIKTSTGPMAHPPTSRRRQLTARHCGLTSKLWRARRAGPTAPAGSMRTTRTRLRPGAPPREYGDGGASRTCGRRNWARRAPACACHAETWRSDDS